VIRIEYVYWLCGALLAVCAYFDLRARRLASALFWGVLAACFVGGDAVQAAAASGNPLPAELTGLGVIVLAAIAGSGRLKRRESERDGAPRQAAPSNRLFVPALAIPLGTLAFLLLQKPWPDLLDAKQPTLAALGLACVLALVAALLLTRAGPRRALAEGARLLDALSWAALLPMLLATLGAVFAATGVGDAVAQLVSALIPVDSRLACLVAYALGMVAFTAIMGNAFAAFPVLTAGIGVPLLIGRHHADAAALGALGMLSGYCGTLLTPMAANFNIVPAALLELKDPNGVIRAQWPTACVLFAANLALMYFAVFR